MSIVLGTAYIFWRRRNVLKAQEDYEKHRKRQYRVVLDKEGQAQQLELPPVIDSPWLPYFGVWFQLSKNPRLFLKECQARYGDVFTLHICGRRYTILMNQKHHGVFYLAPDEEVRAVGSPFAALLGTEDTALFQGFAQERYLEDTAKWLSLFHRHVAIGLQGPFLRHYIPYVREDAIQFLTTTLKQREGFCFIKSSDVNISPVAGAIDINLFEAIEAIAIKTNLRMMLDTSYLEKNGHVVPLFYQIKQFFEKYAAVPWLRTLILYSPSRINYEIWAAVREVKRTIHEHIMHYYDNGEDNTILFTALRQSKAYDLPGGPPRGILIVVFILLLTSTANAPLACFWVMYELTRNPAAFKKARDEQDPIRQDIRARGLDPNVPSSWKADDMAKMTYLDACVNEAIRLYQGTFHAGNVLRGIHTDQQVDQFVLPAGDILALSTHRYRDPQLFEHPDEFIPERWLDPEMKKRTIEEQFSFSPFGHGLHTCPGRSFARVFIKTVVGGYVAKLDVEIPKGSIFTMAEPPFTGINPPMHGPNRNIVRIRPRESSTPI